MAGFERGVPTDRRLVDGNHLVEMLDTFDLVELARVSDAQVEVAMQGLDEDVADQRTLAGAGNAGDANEHAQGNLDVDVLEIIVAGTADDEPKEAGERGGCPALLPFSPSLFPSFSFTSTANHAADGRHFDPPAAGKIRPREALLSGSHFRERSGSDDPAAANARPRAEIDDMVGCPHGVFVVFHDHDRVALVAKLGKRFQQLVVIAGMEADGRFVENVEHAHQPAADLACQADALHLAAGKGWGRAVERQVVEADVS